MAQLLKVLAAKPDDLSLIPGTHMVEGKNQRPQVVLWPPQVHCGTHTSIHNAHTKQIVYSKKEDVYFSKRFRISTTEFYQA